MYAKDLSEPKYQFLIKKRGNAEIKNLDDPIAFKNIADYNPKRNRKILIMFDDMIAEIMTNKKFQVIIRELFIRCRNLNIPIIFITESYFSVPKDVRLNSTLPNNENSQKKTITTNCC